MSAGIPVLGQGAATLIAGLQAGRDALTKMFHAGFPDARIAGGYLRDLYLGRKPKDMDIFIANRWTTTPTMEAALSSAFGTPVRFQCDMGYGPDSEVDRVFAQALPGACPLQIIELAEGIAPADRFQRYDWGLCQIELTLDGGVNRSEAFERDLLASTCTLVHCESEREHARSMRRWARWQSEMERLGIRMVDPTPWA